MKHRAARPIAVLLLAVSIACQYDPVAHEFTSVKPTDEELIGHYELDHESIEMLRHHDLPRPSSRFVLQRDGTFAISDVPTCWREAFECSLDMESANGTWQVVKENEWWVVRLHLTEIQRKASDYGMVAHVRGDRPPRLLHFPVGDPDAGQALAFRKLPVP
jgi:hypothetical protein